MSWWDSLKRMEWGFPKGPTGPPYPGKWINGKSWWIPDPRQYKVEDIPELLDVKKKLAARGLKDPWLRNEVWRYDRRIFGDSRFRFVNLMVPGLIYGMAFFAVVVVCEEFVFKKEDHTSHH